MYAYIHLLKLKFVIITMLYMHKNQYPASGLQDFFVGAGRALQYGTSTVQTLHTQKSTETRCHINHAGSSD